MIYLSKTPKGLWAIKFKKSTKDKGKVIYTTKDYFECDHILTSIKKAGVLR